MSIELTRNFLLWNMVLNYGILLVWFLVFVMVHDSLKQWHGRWFVCPMNSSMPFTIWECRSIRLESSCSTSVNASRD